MQRALDHIDQHLDGDLDLEAVSSVAAFSKFHFHRQFKATADHAEHGAMSARRRKPGVAGKIPRSETGCLSPGSAKAR